jgi:hypothetical protein
MLTNEVMFQFHIFHSIYSIGIKQNRFHSKNKKSAAGSIEPETIVRPPSSLDWRADSKADWTEVGVEEGGGGGGRG